MKRLDIEIKTNGHTYVLHRRSEKVALYKQYFEDMHVGWELFIIKSRDKETIKGVEYPKREIYASNSDFGVSAWALRASMTSEEAIKRFEKLEQELV